MEDKNADITEYSVIKDFPNDSVNSQTQEINTFQDLCLEQKIYGSASNAQTSSENINCFQIFSKNRQKTEELNRKILSENILDISSILPENISDNYHQQDISEQNQQRDNKKQQNSKLSQHQKSKIQHHSITQTLQQNKIPLKNYQSSYKESPKKNILDAKNQQVDKKADSLKNICSQKQKAVPKINKQEEKIEKKKSPSEQILKQIAQIEEELQLTLPSTQSPEDINFESKKTALEQKISQIKQNLKQLEESPDQDNQFFIESYQQQLQKAQRLNECYQLLKNIGSNKNSEYQELIQYFKLQKTQKKEMISAIEKKLKSINSKLAFVKKLKSLKLEQMQKKSQFENEIQKLNRLNEIVQSLDESQFHYEPKKIEPYLTFVSQSKQIGKVKLQFQKTIHQSLKQLNKIEQNLIIKFYLKNSTSNKNVEINPNLKLIEVLQQPYQNLYICQIQECIQILFDNNETKSFKKGIDLTDILKKQKIRGKNYFFFSDYKQYDEQTAQQNLELRQCQICNIRYFGKIHKNMVVPLKVQTQKAILYIDFPKMELQKLQYAFINKVKIQGVEHFIESKKTLFQFLKSLPKEEQIQELIIQYKIHLKIDLISAEPRQIELMVNSKQKISKLKQNFQKQSNIDKKLQKWAIQGRQIMNETCFQQLQIFYSWLRLQVSQIKNLEYYGFQTEQEIDTDIYTNFYVEDDQKFKNKIEQSEFPSKFFQFAFRINALSKIFSCIKKHCRIKAGLDSIKSIVASSNKRCDLWMPTSSQQQTLFNENYVLLHILNSAKKDLAIQLCRTYKNHSPIPLKTVKINGKVNDMRQTHYWICTKSLNIVSLEILGQVKGKSTFLNQMFKTDFQTESKHPISKKSVFIKYDIYRNPNYLVDLIDVSSGSMNQKQKIKLCQHANILMIHLYESQQKDVKKWIQKNCKDTPIIYIYRQSNSMKNQEKFKKEMEQNKESKLQKKFHIINIQKQTFITHHQYKFREISNCINQFVIEVENQLEIQKKWLLNKYFQNNNKALASYTSKLKNLQKQFSNIVDLKLLSGDHQNKSSIKNSKIILDLIDIQNSQNISNFMSKMKEFSRIQRTRNLSLFSSNLQKIKNILEKKNDYKIQDRKQQLSKYFQNLQSINPTQKTKIFTEGLLKFRQDVQSLTYQKLDEIYTKYLKKQIDQQIEKKEFSIQNFWRILLYIYSASQDLKEDQEFKKIQEIISVQALKIFSVEFQKGKTIQLINGDSLQMPIKLFKNHHQKLAGKNIMVIAVVGGQSSGKSNLLNFLFGCDFLSSQGRCTSGVYMTYYEIQGENIPGCDGILVLDTEGLFSNHVRQKQEAKNFDNKLLLFLLKSVDILIVNCQGQIKKDIQDILQLSFDSELMKFQPGTKYPHFNIVLNMKPDSMNSQNITQIQVLRQNIVENNPEMQKFISSEQSNELPFAFTSKNDQGMETFLSTIQRNQKIATKKFYEATRTLSLNLLNIIKKRGLKFQPRTLENVYDEMYSTWSTLLRFPILTQHVNRRLKQFEDAVQKYICQQIQSLLNQKAKIVSLQIPNKIVEIDPWMQKRLEQIQASNKRILDDFQQTFMNKSIETNDLGVRYKDKLTDKLKSFETNFKLLITQNKYKLYLSDSQNKGLQNLNKKARLLRSSTLKQQQKQKQFYKGWSKYVEGIQQKIDRRSNSQQIFHNLQLFYNNHMKNNQIARLSQQGYQQSSYQTLDEYYEKIKNQFRQKIENIQSNNAIEARQIEPVISISQQQTTDLKYHYFDMRIFFEPVPTKFFYYLNYKSLDKIINAEEINKKVKFQLKQSQIIKNFIEYLSKDMWFFGITFNKEELTKKLIDEFNIPQYSNTKVYFDQWHIFVNKKVFENNFEIFKNAQNNMDSNSDKFTNYNQKKQQKNKNKPSQDQNQKNKQKQREKDGQFRKNQAQNWNQISIRQRFELFQVNEVKNAFEDASKWWHTPIYNGDKAKDVGKFLIERSIQKYVQNNIDLYRQCLDAKRKKYIQESFVDLRKIGIYPNTYHIQNYYSYVRLLECQFKHVEVAKYSQISEIINAMSSLIIKKSLISLISEQKVYSYEYKSECIAYSLQKKIQIKEDFKIHKQLSRYKDRQYDWLHRNIKNKEFVNFVKKYIKFQRILDEIKKTIEQMKGELKIQEFVQVIAIVIKKQLEDFNLDLKQISHGVSLQFIYLVHELTKKLIWKKLQIQRMKKIKEQQEKLKKDENEQKRIFFDNLQLNSEPRSRSSSAMFIDLYKKFVEPMIKNQKQKFLEQKQREFQETYTRKTIQDFVDTQMMNCNDPDVLIQYLRSPGQVLKSYYNNFLERKIEQIENEFYCESKNCVTELHKIFKEMLVNYNEDPFKWQVDNLFQQKCIQQKDKDELAVILKKILIEVIISGENITANYNNNKYELKEQVIIQAQKPISHHVNYTFLKGSLEFEIMNLAHFVKFTEKGLEGLKKDVEKQSSFLYDQIDSFRQKSKLVLCDKVCPCCDRLCDVDMRDNPHHTIHRIDSGHQMRAVKGMIVQKTTDKGKEEFASVIRCEDVAPKDTFEFYGQQYQWQFFKQLKSTEWSFDSKQVNKLVFQKIWNTCGSKLCEQFTKSGKPMKFIQYSQGNIRFIQQSQQNTEYIFAIDGSGSMQGNPWDQQLKAVQSILRQIGTDSSNTASILVFDQKCYPFCINQKPGPINVKQIQFPGGGTTPDPTFKEAARIIRHIISREQKNVYFFYISDGYSTHPSEGIRQLLECKKQMVTKNLKFSYTSILIGQCSTGTKCMQAINQQMGGKSEYVANAGNLGQKMKQVLRS